MSLLYLGIGRSVSVAPEFEHSLHRHSTLQITLALGQPFLFRTRNARWRRTRGVAVNSDVPHQAGDLNGSFVTIHILPERWRTFHRAGGFLDGDESRYLDDLDLSAPLEFFRGLLRREAGCSRVFQEAERLVEELTGLKGWTYDVDARLLRVLERIQAGLSGPLRSRDLARVACLSEDRFLHLFKEQLGITLRHHIIHQRLLRATADVLAGASVTDAAFEAGFSDSSHFSRKFVQLTGFPPSRLKRVRGTFRIYSCHSSACVRPIRQQAGPVCADCALFREQKDAPPFMAQKP